MSSEEMYLVSNELAEPGEFKIHTEVACLSGLVQRMIGEYGAVTDQFYKYTLKKVDKKTLRMVLQYLQFHCDHKNNDRNDQKQIHEWDEKFINGLDYGLVTSLREASKYMEISSLYDLVDSKSRLMVTLLPWDKNKGFNVALT